MSEEVRSIPTWPEVAMQRLDRIKTLEGQIRRWHKLLGDIPHHRRTDEVWTVFDEMR